MTVATQASPRAATLRVLAGSTLYACGMVLSILAFAPPALLTFPLPLALRFRFISQWARFNLWWLERTCGLGYTVHGLENVPERACVVLCKHQSAWETLALQRFFRPQVWVLKRELLWIPFFGWGLAMLRPIAIDRTTPRKAIEQIIEQGRQRLADGSFVVIFPEGTRVPPGERRRYLSGGAMLARRAGTLVVPVALNAGEYWPRNSFLKYPGHVQVVIGPPIDTAGRSAGQINALAEEWIESTMTRIGTQQPAPAAGPQAARETT